MSYRQIIDHVSFQPTHLTNITEEQAQTLLLETAKYLRIPAMRNNTYGDDKRYFVYVAGFPKIHVAIDNGCGTTRLHSITTLDQLHQIKVKP